MNMSISGAQNPSTRLAAIRSLINDQQQVIALLENKLQQSILGGDINTGLDVDLILSDIAGIYDGGGAGSEHSAALTAAMTDGAAALPIDGAEQDAIRHMLYQARALMGELRIEEQGWNSEVSEEKTRRKELKDFTKG